MGLATEPAGTPIPERIFEMFPVLKEMLQPARRRSVRRPAAAARDRPRARRMSPKLLILDEPTEGIQPSIIKDIERVIRVLAAERRDGDPAGRAVLRFRASRSPTAMSCMSRGEIIKQGLGKNMDAENVRACLAL